MSNIHITSLGGEARKYIFTCTKCERKTHLMWFDEKFPPHGMHDFSTCSTCLKPDRRVIHAYGFEWLGFWIMIGMIYLAFALGG